MAATVVRAGSTGGCRWAPRARPHPRRHPLRAAPRRNLATRSHRGPTNGREGVRHQPANAQHPLRLRPRGSTAPAAASSRRRVEGGSRGASRTARQRITLCRSRPRPNPHRQQDSRMAQPPATLGWCVEARITRARRARLCVSDELACLAREGRSAGALKGVEQLTDRLAAGPGARR